MIILESGLSAAFRLTHVKCKAVSYSMTSSIDALALAAPWLGNEDGPKPPRSSATPAQDRGAPPAARRCLKYEPVFPFVTAP